MAGAASALGGPTTLWPVELGRALHAASSARSMHALGAHISAADPALLLGAAHGATAVCGAALLAWCCCAGGAPAPGLAAPQPRNLTYGGGSTPQRQQCAASPVRPQQGVPAGRRAAEGAAWAVAGGAASTVSSDRQEEIQLLSWNISYLRELATSILQMDTRIETVDSRLASQQCETRPLFWGTFSGHVLVPILSAFLADDSRCDLAGSSWSTFGRN